jgi:hypothetical protein
MCWACQQDPWAGFIHPTARWHEGVRRACERKAARNWDMLGREPDGAAERDAVHDGGMETRGDERSH